MNINFKFLLIGTSLSLIPALTYAQCSPAQNCAELGYKENANKGGCLKCPFGDGWYCPCDTSYKYTCTGSNEKAGTEKCGNKYKSCTCSDGFEWKDDKCQKREETAVLGECTGYAKNCKIADILNSDGTCTTDKVNGKIPIGVVVYIGSDNCGYAMTASPIATNIIWSTEYVDTGAFQSSNWQNAIKDFDVSGNMTKIIQTSGGNSSKYPAAYAALNYASSSAPTSKGKWMLPTAGIINSLYTNLSVVNNTISKLGGTKLTDYNEHIWSSSEFSSSHVWYFSTSFSGGIGRNYKDNYYTNNNNYVVRPVLKF